MSASIPETVYVVVDTDQTEGEVWADNYGGALGERAAIREELITSPGAGWCEGHRAETDAPRYALEGDTYGTPVCRECLEGHDWVEYVTADPEAVQDDEGDDAPTPTETARQLLEMPGEAQRYVFRQAWPGRDTAGLSESDIVTEAASNLVDEQRRALEAGLWAFALHQTERDREEWRGASLRGVDQ